MSDANVANTSSDIGISQFVVALNRRFRVYSRTSAIPLLASVSNTSFWSGLTGPDAASLCATNPQGQPSVAYDEAADRWVVSEAAYAGAGATLSGAFVMCVAVSTSPDATGTWNRYVFQVSASLYPNQPTLGVWPDGYYLSFNQHTANDTWAGAGALALERSKMLTGAAAQARYFDLQGVTPGLGGMLPADFNGKNAPVVGAAEPYLQAHDDPLNLNDRLEVWGFHVDWTAPVTGSTFQPVVNLPLNGGGFSLNTTFSCVVPGSAGTLWSACLSQKPPAGQLTTQQLEPLAQAHSTASDNLPQLGGRLQWGRTAGGTETLTATATVNVGGNVADPAWFNLSNVGGAGWTVGAKGIFNPGGGISRFLPSAALDNSGNVGLAYLKTDGGGGNLDPSTAYTNATNGGFGEINRDTGNVPFTVSPTFGRYTTLSLDPVDACTFWFSGPLPDNAGATISIDDYALPGCVASATQPPLLTADPWLTAPLVREGLTITGHSATFTSATSVTQQWRLCDSRGLNCVDIAGATGMTHVATASDAAGDRTLRFEEIATNANGTSRSVSAPSTIVQSIPPVSLTLPVLSGTAQSGKLLTTTNGTWQSSSPVSYTYRWRRCTSGVCANIAGANAATYTLTDTDVGTTVDVVVSATNTGGGTDANASATSTIAAAPVVSSGGGSGGGGGGAGSPDLAVTGFASNSTPVVGDNVTFLLTVTDKNGKPAQQLNLNVTLGAGLQFVTSTTDRGNPCTSVDASHLNCFLDWLSSDVATARLQITVKVNASSGDTFSATASAGQGEFDPADNTLALTLTAAASAQTAGGTPVGLNGDGTPTKKQDKSKPVSRALASNGRRGHAAQLRFRVYDNNGFAKVMTTVKHNGIAVGAASTGYGPVAYGSVYFVGWHVPSGAAEGTYSFCVVALDRAGNKSPQSCAPLALK